ncbi:PEPxxWA-CTERM sorting domain-containing protein [Sphingomonas sp. LR60]|uniref:PEPxxWA-CTERM sorting domain-containing protein n=1 Tax=Sphingomonas sp. LR60 TaxID=3050233 RepID=UPI002FE12DA0
MRSLVLTIAAAASFVAAPALAMPTIGNTGVDSNWTVNFLGDTLNSPSDAQALSTDGAKTAVVVASSVKGWLVGDSMSKWVSTSANAASSPGWFSYSNTFSAAADDVLNFDFAADDKLSRVLLNGVEVGATLSNSYRSFSSGSVSGLAAGLNTLTFVISNNSPGQNANINPSGFRFQTASTAAVPEPATWMMLMAGFGVIGYTARSRRRSGNYARAML